MISGLGIHLYFYDSSHKDDFHREMHPDLVGLQESREKPYEMSTK